VKKRIYGDTLRDRLASSARDRMQSFLLCGGTVRGAMLEATKLVNEMRSSHELGILETLILGHAYIGALLLSSNLKGQDRIVLEVTCDGPAKGFAVEANAFGEVRGYLKTDAIPLESPLESFDTSPFIGEGTLAITKILEKAKHPFTGQVRLAFGTVAKDLANFSAKSEQIPSAYHLSVKFDPAGEVVGAGGLMIQALPGAEPGDLDRLQEIVEWLPSIGDSFAAGRELDTYLAEELADFDPVFVASRRVEFMCHCNEERFERFLRQLPQDELESIATEGPFPLVLRCHNCNTSYEFSRDRVERLFDEARREEGSAREPG
jgi:molecular chaperone Hsp33